MAQDHARVPSTNVTAGIGAVSAGTQILTSGTVSFANSNGVSFGLDGQTLTATVITSGIGISAGTQSASTGTVIFSNSNNVTFGMSGSQTVTASASFAQTVQPGVTAIGVSTAGNTAGDTGTTQGTVVLQGGNNVTLSQVTAAGSLATVVFSAANQTVQTQNCVDVTLAGNTSGALALISSGTLTLAGGNNITLSQAGNAITISAANGTQTVPPIGTSIEAVATASSVGTVTRFAAEDHRHAGVMSMGVSTDGVTLGDTIVTAGQFVFAGANAITALQTGTNGSYTIQILGPAPDTIPLISDVTSVNSSGTATGFYAMADHRHAGIQGIGVSTGGNTAGTTGTSQGKVIFAGGNNITLSQSTGPLGRATITISAFNQTAPVVSNALQDVSTATGSGTNTSRFAADDHVHRGLRAWNAQGTASTFFGDVQFSAGAAILFSTGGNSTAGSLRIFNSWSTATMIPESVSSTGAVGANAGRFALEAHVHAGVGPFGVSNVGNTAGNTTVMHGQVVLAGGNAVTLSVSSSNNNAQTITISVPTVPVVSNGLLDVTTATNSGTGITQFAAHDHQHRGVRAIVPDTIASSFYGNVVMSAGSLIAISTGGDSTAGSVIFHNLLSSATTVSQVASANAVGAMASRFALEAHQHAGVPAIAPGSNTGNTAGDTATQFGTWVIAGSDNITISGSSGAAGIHTAWIKGAAAAGAVIGTSVEAVASASSVGTVTRFAPEDHRHAGLNTISIIGNTAGTTTAGAGSIVLAGGQNITLSNSTAAGGMTISIVGPVPLSTYDVFPNFGGNNFSSAVGASTSNSISVWPFIIPVYVSAGILNLLFSANFTTVGNNSGRQTAGLMLGLYTRGTGTASSTIGSLLSTSFRWTVTGNNSSYSIDQVTATNYTGYGATAQTNSAGSNITSQYTGGKLIGFPINSLLSPGNYWLAMMGTNSTTSNNVGLSLSYSGVIMHAVGFSLAPLGSLSSAFSTGHNPVGGRWNIGHGVWTSAGSVTALPASMAFASISVNFQSFFPIMKFWST